MDNIIETYVENNMIKWHERLKNARHVIEQVLKRFAENALRGIQCTTKEQKTVRRYLVLGPIAQTSQNRKTCSAEKLEPHN